VSQHTKKLSGAASHKAVAPGTIQPSYDPSQRPPVDTSNMPGVLEPELHGERGVYLLTHPRSASNLFQTMMSKQPGYQNSGYKLFDAGFASLTQLSKGRLSGWPEAERKALYDTFRLGFDSLQDELEDARKNVSLTAVA
jgi:hypothetical protein